MSNANSKSVAEAKLKAYLATAQSKSLPEYANVLWAKQGKR